MTAEKKLWGGRFSSPTSHSMETFSASVGFDRRLYQQDIAGSIAHARMLYTRGILSKKDFSDIQAGLLEIREEIGRGEFDWTDALEDVHMNIEQALTDKIGEAGKKLHTGRSRNDQVATDMRLYLRDEVDQICTMLTNLQHALIDVAEREASTLLPGFTHMQTAQPVTLGHHILAWNEMFQRDYERFQDGRKRMNTCPLGSAALAGVSYPIDREMTSAELGFDSISRNSLDAVSDRDFLVEFAAHASLMMVHLSRICEELVWWSSQAYSFIDLGDEFCTGSSIMPQKKNPDIAELIRGKCGRVNGSLVALLMLMKGQPLAYNRDNQEDKEPIFDIVDTVRMCLDVFAQLVPVITFHRDTMEAAAEEGYATATDLADYLVMKNVPFRDAHKAVGKVVGYAVEHDLSLSDIDLEKLRNFCPAVEKDVYEILDVRGSVRSRDHVGGTAPGRVKQAVVEARKLLHARTTKAG